MAKLTLTDITSGYQTQSAYNANNQLVEDAIENTLSRDGTSPNQMEADLDLNSNDLINAQNIRAQNIFLNGTAISIGDVVAGNKLVHTATATAGQSTISGLPTYVPNTNSIDLFIAGAHQNPDAYSQDSPTSLTLTGGDTLDGGEKITVLLSGANELAVANASNVSYTPSGVGAIGTNVQDKLRETVSVKDFGATGDGVTNNNTSFVAADAANKSLFIPIADSSYKIVGDLVLAVPKTYGEGWYDDDFTSTMKGSLINTNGGITFNSPLGVRRGLVVSDLSLSFTGSSGLVIDDFIYNRLSHLHLDGNTVTTNLLTLTQWAFFSEILGCVLSGFTGIGLLVDTAGTKNAIRDCNISSGVSANATSAIEVRDEGTSIYDGQAGVARADGAGIGIHFYNSGAPVIYGGLVQGTLFEDDIGVRIDALTSLFGTVVGKNTRHTLGSGQTAIVFGKAYQCVLDNPTIVSPTGGYVAKWEADAIKCGVIGNYDACRAQISVDPSATDSYMVCTAPITYAERSDISTDSNLSVTCEDVQYVGKTSHNGVSWDKFSEAINDDSFTTITPPDSVGNLVLRTATGGAEYAILAYNTSTGVLTTLLAAGAMDVITTDGTLTGTTGTDGFLVVRASSTGVIYVENRRNSSRRFYIEFQKV